MNRFELVRAAFGLSQLIAPSLLFERVPGVKLDSAARVVIRVLAVRHLVQAALTVSTDDPRVHGLGALADGLHAASMIGLAIADPRRRRGAIASAVIASTFAAGEAYIARKR